MVINLWCVDCNDQDSRDYSLSIRTNRWYIRFFPEYWIGLFKLNTPSWHFLLSRVSESRNGRNTGTKIRADIFSKLILGYLFSTTVSALTGIEYWRRDLATCEQVRSSSFMIVRNASSVCRTILMVLPINHENKQQYLWKWRQTSVPTCRWILGWNQGLTVRCVTESSTHNWIDSKGEEKDVQMQNLCYGMFNLQGTYLQRVLKRGARYSCKIILEKPSV